MSNYFPLRLREIHSLLNLKKASEILRKIIFFYLCILLMTTYVYDRIFLVEHVVFDIVILLFTLDRRLCMQV